MTTTLLLLLLVVETPATEATEPTAAKTAPLPRLLVVDLKVEQGVSDSAARLLNEMLLTKLQATGRYEVFGQADLRSMLDLEKEKLLTGCTDVACMAEIAGAMGAERALFGSVGTLGDSYVLNLRLINNLEVRVEARWSETFEGDESELVGAVDRAVTALVPVESAAVAEEDESRFYQTWWFWTLVGAGALGATAGIVAAASVDGGGDSPAPMVNAGVEVVLP